MPPAARPTIAPTTPAPGPKDPGAALPAPVTSAVPGQLSYAHPKAVLQIRRFGQWSNPTGMDWQQITLGADGTDTTCRIAIKQLDRIGSPANFDRRMAELSSDRLVRVLAPWGPTGERVLFQGFPQVHAWNYTPDGQGMTTTCLHEGQEKLRSNSPQKIMGRIMAFDPLAVADGDNDPEDAPSIIEVEALPATFNAGGRPNRMPNSIRFPSPDGAGFELHLYTEDDAPEAAYWTYAQALRHLVYFYIMERGAPIDVGAFMADTDEFSSESDVQTVDNLARRITAQCADVTIDSLHAEEALVALTQAAGLSYTIPFFAEDAESSNTAQSYLRVYVPIESSLQEFATPGNRLMISPTVRDLSIGNPRADLSSETASDIAESHGATESEFTHDLRAYTHVIYRGGKSVYEAYLYLRPGWQPHHRLDNMSSLGAVDSATKTDLAQFRDIAKKFWLDQFEDEYEFPADPSDLTNRVPRSIYHTQHPYHATEAAVFRKWLFPDHWRYVDTGLGRDADDAPHIALWDPAQVLWPEALYSPFTSDDPNDKRLVYEDLLKGAGLDAAIVALWVPRARPFVDRVSRSNSALTDTSPLVEFNFTADTLELAAVSDDWVPYAGKARFDKTQAALWLDEPNLRAARAMLSDPNDRYADPAIERYIDGKFWVRVLCGIEGDERMRTTGKGAPGLSRQRTGLVDLGFERFTRRFISEGNVPTPTPSDPDPRFNDRDDDARLLKAAARGAERLGVVAVSGSPELFYINTEILPGDSFSGIDGLGMPFARYPHVVRKSYHNDAGGSRTVLNLSDTRNDPGDEDV